MEQSGWVFVLTLVIHQGIVAGLVHTVAHNLRAYQLHECIFVPRTLAHGPTSNLHSHYLGLFKFTCAGFHISSGATVRLCMSQPGTS